MLKNDSIHTGQCLCGQVCYQVQGKPIIVAHCHCVDCQRLSGAGHSTGAMFPVSSFHMEGQVGEFRYPSDNGNTVTRVFCPSCGSPILGKNTAAEGFVTISLGTLDNSDDFQPEVVVFARNRKPWDYMDHSICTFEAQPQWNPEGD